jgi:hypothetical protein
MRSYETILIVAASTGLGAGVTMILLSIPEYYEQSQSLLEIVGLILGAVGIVIGGVIAYFQNKQTKKMDKIISGTHIREQNVKVEVLRRVLRDTNEVRTILNRIRSLIRHHT